jgi:palmitoyl-protein thioesterase
LEANRFLTSINNERPDSRNATYVKNFASLNKLVLVLFSKDKTVIPLESSWFGSEAIPEDDATSRSFYNGESSQQEHLSDEKVIIPMRLQPLYLEDWIGLRQLDERGDVIFETCEGEHMDIGDCWKPLVQKFAGGQL